MRTITKEIFKFDELSDSAKQTAIMDYEWWDFVEEDAKEIGKILGIDIDKLYFSGFSSQGDGACFEGSYSYSKGCSKEIRGYAPKDEKLHQIADTLTAIQKPRFYRLTATVKQSGHYMHKYCTDVKVYLEDGITDSYADIKDDEAITDTLRDFMQWIYDQLEAEYWGLTTDEAITDTIEANEWEFDESGNMI